MNRRMIQGGSLILALALLCGAAFAWLYAVDNKYTAALPAGEGRSWLEAALTGSPRFLVDGWEYYPGQLLAPEDFTPGKAPREHVYAGQYPNFSNALGTPYGEATYRMVLANPGETAHLSLFLPEIPSASRVYINGEFMGETGSVEPYLAISGIPFTPLRQTETPRSSYRPPTMTTITAGSITRPRWEPPTPLRA